MDDLKKKRIILLVSIFVLAGLVAFLDRVGHFLMLYWTVWWYDMILHFLGGALVGAIGAWGYFFVLNGNARYIVKVSVLTALVIGALWEVYEFVLGMPPGPKPYVLDTIIDLIMDVVGGYFAGTYMMKFINARKENSQDE